MVKRVFYIGCYRFLLAAIILLFVSCVQDGSREVIDNGVFIREFEASFMDKDTKTTLVNGSKVSWNVGDVVHYYSETDGEVKTIAVSENGRSALFSLETPSHTSFVAAVYGAKQLSHVSVSGVCIEGVVQTEQSGRFSDAHLSVAYTNNPDSGQLLFYNYTSIISFKLQRRDIAYVLFKPKTPIPYGKLVLSFGNWPNPQYDISQSPTVGAIKILTSPGAGEYFISMFPGTVAGGFEMLFYNSSDKLLGLAQSNKELKLNFSTILDLGVLDSHITKQEQVANAIDLGLSVKWASCNIGAKAPEDNGEYFAWGETEHKQNYDYWESYKWCGGNSNSFTKYNTNVSYGNIDNITLLEPSDDAASFNWGDKWRIPTEEEWEELCNSNNCDWSPTTQNGQFGYKITSKKEGYKGKSIFLPAAGYQSFADIFDSGSNGYYWSSILDTGNPSLARLVYFSSSNVGIFGSNRCGGFSVRPVYGDYVTVSSIVLDKASVGLSVGETIQLNATISPANTTEKTVRWETNNSNIATVSTNGFITAKTVGEAIITAYASNGKSASCVVTVGTYAVDLGLSVKWASCNLWSDSPEGSGRAVAWGETTPKYDYQDAYYKFYNTYSIKCPLYKYNTISSEGIVDNLMILQPDDDAASVKLGESWRMPTDAEWKELKDNCTWTWATRNSINGYKIASKKNGFTENSIFLPVTGYRIGREKYSETKGYYWSSSLDIDAPKYAWAIGFSLDKVECHSESRHLGLYVRPVYGSFISASSVTLNQTSAKLTVGESLQLTASLIPSNTTDKRVRWVTNNGIVAMVSSDGLITATATGSAIITAIASSGKSVSCTITVTNSRPNALEVVDLGLSVKWASCNIGANAPEDNGEYFAWGETSAKTIYSWDTYRFLMSGSSNINVKFKKYNTSNSRGTVDNKTVLELPDDAAHEKWHGSWRMPTESEWNELIDNCNWTWTTLNGVYGYRVTSKIIGYTDKTLFIPAAGRCVNDGLTDVGSNGRYWSSSLDTDSQYCARSMGFDMNDVHVSNAVRSYGRTVRPVFGDFVEASSIIINFGSVSLTVGETIQLTASISPGNATDQTVRWITENNSVATVSNSGIVSANAAGRSTIIAYASNGLSASCTVTVNEWQQNGFEPVDLGLSVKWAPWNVGAHAPEDYGDYFAWGETEPKGNYSTATYKWYSINNGAIITTKYTKNDNKTVLDNDDDAACVRWGGTWRTPTSSEWQELINNCIWTWTTLNGVYGYKVKSNISGFTGRYIFLPATGRRKDSSLDYVGSYGYYWTSTRKADSTVLGVNINKGSAGFIAGTRSHGFSVRPVTE